MNPMNPQDTLSESQVTGDSPITVEELQYHFEGLRSLFLFALVALIALTLTLDIFFLRRMMVTARAQREEQRPKINKMAADSKTLVKNFTESLESFAASHQDFQPILDRYRPFLLPYKVPPSAATPSTSPATAPK